MALSDDQRFAMYTAEEIGNAIKKRRRQLKITQKEFAERLGKSERTIQKYESGEITMNLWQMNWKFHGRSFWKPKQMR